MTTKNLPAALQLLDEKQKKLNLVTFRKIEEDELSRMELDPSYKSFWDVLRDPLYREISERIPPLQSIIQFKTLEDKKNNFEKLIQTSFTDQEKYCTSENIYFGTVISSQFNAYIEHLPKQNEYLIILNEVFWEAMRYISDVFSAPLSFKETECGFNIDYAAAQDHAHRFGEIMHRLVNFQHLWGIDLKFNSAKNETWQLLWNEFHEAMESFAFGHEYGHFARRHQFKDKNSIAEKWASEYDADMVALDLIAISILQDKELSSKYVEPFLISLCGCYLLYMLLYNIEEFSFSIASDSDSHPPTIFRYANFKRKIFEQMGSTGLAELDKYISSMHDLESFYINKSWQLILKDSFDYSNMLVRIERSFQKSAFWNIMGNTHDEMINYLNDLHRKFDSALFKESNDNESINSSYDDISKLKTYISNLVLSLKGAEELLEFSVEKQILNKGQVLKMIQKCCDVFKMNKAARSVPIV